MPYDIVIPKKLKKKFKEIGVQYTWFLGKLKETLNSLMQDPTVGSIEFKKGYQCYGVLIAHYMLYYSIDSNRVEILDIERIFYTW